MTHAWYEKRAAQWGLAVLVAGVLCCSYPLMFAYRTVWQSQHPELAARWENDGGFAILTIFGGEQVQEEVSYAARVREAAEHLLPFDPFVNENRSALIFTADHLTYRIMALPYLVSRNMDATWLFWRVMCSILWFVLIYRLALRASGSPPQALFCGVFVTCFSYLLTLVFLSNIQWSGSPLHLLMHNAWTVLSYGRTEGLLRLPRPGFTYAALFFACHLAVRAAERTERRWVAYSGIAGGLLAYIRPDAWSMYMGTIVVFAALQSYWKKKLDVRLFTSAGISLMLSLPFLWVMLNVDHETARRTSLARQTAYDFSSWAYLIGCIYLLRRRREPVHVFLASMLAFMFLFLHAPLVTGFSIQPEHWKYIANIFFFIAIVSLLPKSWARGRLAWEAAAGVLLSVCLLQGVSFAALHYPFFGLPRDIEGGLGWIERNARLDSVVLSLDPEINGLVPALTPSKVLIAPYNFVLISNFPLSDNVRRIRYALSLLGVDEKRFIRETLLEGPYVERKNYTSAKREGAQVPLMLNMAFGYNRRDFAGLFRSEEPVDSKGLTEPDYVWIGPFEKKYAAADFAKAHSRWTEVYRNGTVTLYKTKS